VLDESPCGLVAHLDTLTAEVDRELDEIIAALLPETRSVCAA